MAAIVSGVGPDGSTTEPQDAATTGTTNSVGGSGTSVTLLGANPNRVKGGAILVNESAATLYLKYGSAASLTSYTYSVTPGATWEMPSNVRYTGIITGMWSSATGNARITELTP
jgi:hypothetical protein